MRIIGSKKARKFEGQNYNEFLNPQFIKSLQNKIKANEKWKYFNQISSSQIDIKLMGRKILRNKKIN